MDQLRSLASGVTSAAAFTLAAAGVASALRARAESRRAARADAEAEAEAAAAMARTHSEVAGPLGGAASAHRGAHVRGRGHPRSGQRVIKICLTGGPCSGKTTSLQRIVDALSSMDVDAYTLPEVPTLVMSTGLPYPGMGAGELLAAFEDTLFTLQEQFETRCADLAAVRAATLGRPAVLILDRALLDMKAYMPPEIWEWLLAKHGLTEGDIFGRYDAVLHLVTAADGARAFYTSANNAVRTESADEAVELDRKVSDAWAAHPNRRVVPNGPGGFSEKLDSATSFVLDVVKRSSSRARE